MTHVDLAIIGSGSGNTIGTHDFNSWSIAIIEEGVFGVFSERDLAVFRELLSRFIDAFDKA